MHPAVEKNMYGLSFPQTSKQNIHRDNITGFEIFDEVRKTIHSVDAETQNS